MPRPWKSAKGADFHRRLGKSRQTTARLSHISYDQLIIRNLVDDWPMMVAIGEETRYVGDVLAGVVAETDEIAREGVKKLRVKHEVLMPVTDMDQALKEDAPRIHLDGNVLSETTLKRGHPRRSITNAAYVSRGTYYTQRIEHAYLETECAVAKPWVIGSNAGVQVFSQGQGAYEDRR